MRRSLLLWFGLVFGTAVTFFLISTDVRRQREELADLHREIYRHQQALHVLKAEWSYLNRPDRLARLIEKHLELTPIDAHHLAPLAAIPPRPRPLAERTVGHVTGPATTSTTAPTTGAGQ
ncbi:MAG: hypothetical protein QGF33_04160 [Alphaproteobacteria bacterium]|nr:hypothetical protein [Alphaproteobacteria bacterium]